MQEIDARGLSCPAPVLQTKVAVENEGATAVKVMVDNEASQQNVKRFLESQGFQVSLQRQGGDYWILGRCQTAAAPKADEAPASSGEQQKIMVMVATDRIGYGDDELGLKLMVNFINTLKEMGPDLWRLVFVNNGVKLTIDGSAVLTALKTLEQDGLQILVCGTCLDHFKLLDRKAAGETTNMLDIVTTMQLADKVINI
jgi:selenium metabolism protein YedF